MNRIQSNQKLNQNQYSYIHKLFTNVQLVATILSHLDDLRDLNSATRAWYPFYLAEKKYNLRKNIPNGTCSGCWEDQPNQMAHMNIGGCLEDPIYIDVETELSPTDHENEQKPPHKISCQCDECDDRRSFITYFSSNHHYHIIFDEKFEQQSNKRAKIYY